MTRKNKALPSIDDSCSFMDTHCHLDMPAYGDDIDEVLERARKNGVHRVVTIGIDADSSREASRIAARHPMVWATAGIHPHDAGKAAKKDFGEIEKLIGGDDTKIVGYGEIGLDYVKRYCPQDIQRRIFRDQLSIAKNFKLPVIIHDREAHDDVLDILKDHGPLEYGGVMHCFSGDAELARQVIDLGLHISIPGVVTFKKAAEMQEVARQIPLERLLLETDGPFLAPEPFRGKRNEPVYLLYTAEKIAKLRDISLQELALTTTANGCRLFGIPLEKENAS